MNDKHDNANGAEYNTEENEPEVRLENEGVDIDDVQQTEDGEEPSELEALKNLLQKKEEEVEKEKKEYLFLMAEFDNFRKRTLRERTDLLKSAGEKVLKGLLPIVDDFERGLDAIKDSTDAEAVKEGMVLIYNKMIKYLADNGVKEMASTDADFDPDLHEAVAMVPADETTAKGKVKDTVAKGYMINDKVLRHAKVVVAQ
ncbi:MAG: nucleotide exchange factor GrpE [[Clostridium] fimetarium]|nr:nucleotide exchange factor GrpE [Alistipes timonensis]MCM1405668.1 nucleotide exchange factor GrpE [[Clostridium] fimetarium]